MLILLPILLCYLSDKTSIVHPAVNFSTIAFFSFLPFRSLLLMPNVTAAVGFVVVVILRSLFSLRRQHVFTFHSVNH